MADPNDDLQGYVSGLFKGAGAAAAQSSSSLPGVADDDEDEFRLDAEPSPVPYLPAIYGGGQLQQPKNKLGDIASRVGRGVVQFGKDFANDLNVSAPDISGRERLFRAANVASFALPPLAIGRTASLAARAAVRGAEAGAMTGVLAKIRGDEAAPAALTGAGIGAGIETLLTRGRTRFARGRTSQLAPAFNDAAQFAHPASTPLHNSEWAVLRADMTDDIVLSAEKNAERTAALRADLERLGYSPIDAAGVKPGAEAGVFDNAFIVPGISRKEALELAKTYGQRNVVTSEGLFDLTEATLAPLKRSGTRFGADVDPSADFFTVPKNLGEQGRFALEFDQPIGIGRRVVTAPDTDEAALASLFSKDGPSIVDRVLGMPVKSNLQSWYVKLVRSFAEVERMEGFLGKETSQRTVHQSAAKLAQMSAGWSSYAEHAWDFGIPAWDNRTQTVAPALKDLFGRLRAGEFDSFDTYGAARRFRHLVVDREFKGPRLPDGSEMTAERLEGIIQRAEADYPHFAGVFEDVTKWRDTYIHETLVKPGVISEDAYKAITSTSLDYVPLRRAFDEATEQMRNVQNASVVNDPIARISAVHGKLMPWTEALVRDAYSYSRLAHQQDFTLQLIRELEAADPSAAKLFATRVDAPFPELSKMQQTAIAEIASSDPALATAAATTGEELIGLLAPQRMMKQGLIGGLVPVKGMRSEAGKFIEQSRFDAMLAEGEISEEAAKLFTAGDGTQRVWYKVTNADLWEAFQAMNPPEVSLYTKLAGAVASTLRAGATLSLEFMARNPMKDVLYGKVGSDAPIGGFIKGFAHAWNRDDIYQKWLASGGGRASMASMEQGSIREGILTAVHAQESVGSKLANVIKSPIEALQALSDFIESGTRLGIYERQYGDMLRNGVAPEIATREAALASRNGTVDFSVHGSKTQALRMITAFWNAQIQGYDNLRRAFAADPSGTTMRALAYITIPSTLLYFANRRDEEYLALPSWERDMFWHVKIPETVPWVGDKWMRLPKPFDLGLLFGSSVERFLAFAEGVDPNAVDAMVGNFTSRTLEGMIPIPTIARPLVENAINHSFLRNRPVESRALADVEAKFRIQPATSEVAQKLGAWLDYSPVKIDNLLGGYFGGLGRLGTDIADAGIDIASGNPPQVQGGFDPRDVPGLRGLFSSFPRNSEPVDKFYDLADRVRTAEQTRAHLMKSMRFDDLADWLEHKAIMLGSGDMVASTQQQLKMLRTQRDMILRDKSISSAERSRQLDALGRIMLDITSAIQPLQQMIEEEESK